MYLCRWVGVMCICREPRKELNADLVVENLCSVFWMFSYSGGGGLVSFNNGWLFLIKNIKLNVKQKSYTNVITFNTLCIDKKRYTYFILFSDTYIYRQDVGMMFYLHWGFIIYLCLFPLYWNRFTFDPTSLGRVNRIRPWLTCINVLM